MAFKESFVAEDVVRVYRIYRNGSREFMTENKNVVNDTGLALFLDLAGGLSTRYANYFAWGSGATTAHVHTDAALYAETGSKGIDYINRVGSVLTFTCTIGYAEGNIPGIVNEWRGYSTGNPDINVAMTNFANQAKTSDYQLEIDHSLILYNSGT